MRGRERRGKEGYKVEGKGERGERKDKRWLFGMWRGWETRIQIFVNG